MGLWIHAVFGAANVTDLRSTARFQIPRQWFGQITHYHRRRAASGLVDHLFNAPDGKRAARAAHHRASVAVRVGAAERGRQATADRDLVECTAPQKTPTSRWRQFLTDTFGEDTEGREMINYLHLLLGYSVTGDVGAQILAFLYGLGKSGKSVLLDVIVKLLGDYADAAPPGFLMAKQFDGHLTDLAERHGRRVIVCSELMAGDRFESRVKLLTGGDIIKARRMHLVPFGHVVPDAGKVGILITVGRPRHPDLARQRRSPLPRWREGSDWT